VVPVDDRFHRVEVDREVAIRAGHSNVEFGRRQVARRKVLQPLFERVEEERLHVSTPIS
jgi:hypothetical protein